MGGTGTRTGEDTDNAKYWAGLAKAASGGDYVTGEEFDAIVRDVVQRDIALLKEKVTRIEMNAANINFNVIILWDAVFNDVKGNPLIIDFDDLSMITLVGGYWNQPLERLEV